jgi:uncharacterized membrane protein YedE/YeeE
LLVPSFTPFESTVGGLLIGASASILLLLNGRVAGVSGIFGGFLRSVGEERAWRTAFLVGLLVAGLAFSWLRPSAIGTPPSYPVWLMAVAGVVVGAGTELGSGCTSGHGVCGISRGSKRSIVATVTFIATGAATVYALRHVLGSSS